MASTLVALAVLIGFVDSTPGKIVPAPKPPSQAKIAELILAACDQPGRLKTDLISQEEAKAALATLEKSGWKLKDVKSIVNRVLPESSFLIGELRSEKGKAFMRKVAATPGGFDKLDRISQLPDGKRIVRKLIRERDGQRLVEYLTDAKGGKNTSEKLAGIKGHKEFNRPTDRIYTAEQLAVDAGRGRLVRLKADPARRRATKAPAPTRPQE